MAQPPPATDFTQPILKPWEYLLNYREDTVGVVLGAPLTIIAIIALTAIAVWFAVRLYYKNQLDNLESRIRLKDDEISMLERATKNREPPAAEAIKQKPTAALPPTTPTTKAPSLFSDNEIVYPSPDGPLWRWDSTLGAIGPFCPNHPRERLGLKSKYGGIKWKDFEKDHLSFNWFLCPVDNSDEFRFPETPPLRVHDVRTQATDRFRVRSGQKDFTSSWDGVIEIKYLDSEMRWRDKNGGDFRQLLNELPYGANLFLYIQTRITVTPPRLVDTIILDLSGERLDEKDWAPELITEKEFSLRFQLPSSVTYGKQLAQLIVKALGPGGGVIEQHSAKFYVVIARSSTDLSTTK